MSGTLSSYQSAVQLVAGANLAIFAFPKLGTDEFRVESKRWKVVLRHLKVRDGAVNIAALQGFSEFKSDRLCIESKNTYARKLALLMAGLASGYLVYMSEYPERNINSITVMVLLLGLIPATALFLSHLDGRLFLSSSRTKRATIP